MLIMNSRRMIYVHMQKCGGTSIERAFHEHCRWDDVLIGSSLLGEIMQWEYFGKFGLHKHSAAKEIQQVVGRDLWSSYWTWSTVRNPFVRTASLYGYVASLVGRHAAEESFPLAASGTEQANWARHADYPTTEPWSFPAVKAYLLSQGEDKAFSAFIRAPHLRADAAFAPQWWSVQDLDGESVAVNQIVRLEDLATEWPGLCSRLGLSTLELPWHNHTDAQYRVEAKKIFAAPEDIELIQDRFADDFERFGYDPNRVP